MVKNVQRLTVEPPIFSVRSRVYVEVYTVNIWFNHNFSSTAQLIQSLRAEGGYTVTASHKRADAVMLSAADKRVLEPNATSDSREEEVAAYLMWALDVCQDHQIDVLIPERYKGELARSRARFEEVGTRLLVAAEPDVLELVEDKAALYASLPPGLVPIPLHRVVKTAAELDGALEELKYAPDNSNCRLCVKPVEGIFASGFRVLGEVRLSHLLRNALIISPAHLRDLMLRVETESREPTPLLVMQYLAGDERSVDCLGHEGELVRCVVRRKGNGSAQVLEDSPGITRMAAALTETLNLTGVYNIQFKDDGNGTPYLLEVNSRASGGLPMAMLSGLNFYHWALQRLTGGCGPGDVPEPRTGLRVAMGSVALALGEVETRGCL